MRLPIYFEENDIFGLELKSMQDVLNARSLGLHILPEGGEEYLDRRYDEEEGCRDATTDELIEDAQAAFKAVGKIYGIFDTPLDYRFVPAKATTMQSDFYVGQKVYVMHDNKITETTIKQLVLIDGENSFPSSDTMASDFTSAFYGRNNTTYSNEPTFKYLSREVERIRTPKRSSACIMIDGRYRFVELSEVFATKDKLVKHLLED